MLKQKHEEQLKSLCVHDLPHHHFLCLRFQRVHNGPPRGAVSALCPAHSGVLAQRFVVVSLRQGEQGR